MFSSKLKVKFLFVFFFFLLQNDSVKLYTSPSLVGLLHYRVGFILHSLTKLLVHLERSGTYSQLCFPGAVSGAAEPHREGTTCGC